MIKLEILLKLNGMSCGELARRMGITKQQVSQWTTGARRVPFSRRDQIYELLGFKDITLFDTVDESLMEELMGLLCPRKEELPLT